MKCYLCGLSRLPFRSCPNRCFRFMFKTAFSEGGVPTLSPRARKAFGKEESSEFDRIVSDFCLPGRKRACEVCGGCLPKPARGRPRATCPECARPDAPVR